MTVGSCRPSGWDLPPSCWESLPVIVANRQITLPRFSHYALPASLGLAFLVVGLVALISNRKVQAAVLSFLIALSALTHQGLGAAAAEEERTIAAFWHQMAWRAPSIAAGTHIAGLLSGSRLRHR